MRFGQTDKHLQKTFRDLVQAQLTTFAAAHGNGVFNLDITDQHLLFSKWTETDAYGAFGHADFKTGNGTIKITDGGAHWEYVCNTIIHDNYSYAPYYSSGINRPSPTAYGVALQSHGYIQAFLDSGTWADKWTE